jgi:hypothetical protein
MVQDIQIKILEKDPNRRGDLFGRLMADLFMSLGYDEPRLNIHKTGREIDVEAQHRTENRIAVAECKAEQQKCGGDAINKFVGALGIERAKRQVELVGYFVSLSGFTETAIEQEKEVGGKRVILLGNPHIVQELIKGRILVSPEKATDQAGRCVQLLSSLVCEGAFDLLAHETGWIWAVYYGLNRERTHLALVHADGQLLSRAIAQQVVLSDKLCGGNLHSCQLLNPRGIRETNSIGLDRYHKYLAIECGEILLDGLPADNEVGTRRLRLENLFVPLHLEPAPDYDGEKSAASREPVGDVLAKESRLAILATPGGGKSTLIKRLTIAYSDSSRRTALDDRLPKRDWLPLFIRCRELNELARSPLMEIISSISKRAEMGEYSQSFIAHVGEALQAGSVLLLIDGLDEISDESARLSFVKQMRTFLSIYPTVGLIVTSREAGFRIIGKALSGHCKHYHLARLDQEDIQRLTVAWHVEVVGDRTEVRKDAERLARNIIENDRILALAANPLLLTTLLLVKRWVGQLPTRRSVLYAKAIEVLLMTWNVEAHKPLDQEEVVPQLAFVAYVMMQQGIQKISKKRLASALTLARDQMPEILSYAKLSVGDFIERVEHRSSLLMLSGYDLDDGSLLPMYEFRHLTFQEYLTACAIVEGYYPDRKDHDSIVSLLADRLEDERWREVIPLVGVLSGRKAEPLLQRLIEICRELPSERRRSKEKKDVIARSSLQHCIEDEVQVSPNTIQQGVLQLARLRYSALAGSLFQIGRGKYGDLLRETSLRAYLETDSDFFPYGGTVADAFSATLASEGLDLATREFLDRALALMAEHDLQKKCVGLLVAMEFAYKTATDMRRRQASQDDASQKTMAALAEPLLPCLYNADVHVSFAACWALAWVGESNSWDPPENPRLFDRLVDLWMRGENYSIRRAAAWALSAQGLKAREANVVTPRNDFSEFLLKQFREKGEDYNKDFRQASLILGYYLRLPWPDEELLALAKEHDAKTPSFGARMKSVVAALDAK